MSYAKVILITGGSSGLGAAMCSRLAAVGHTVIGTARKPAEQPNGYGLIAMDVTDDASVDRAVQSVLAQHGRIDVLINNAGVGIQGPVEDISVEQAQRAMEVNLYGVHRVCRAVLPGMRKQQSGLVINISSIAANFGLPYRGFYSASKAAVDRYSEALSIENERFGVKVVIVQPGEFNTKIAENRIKPSVISADHRPGYERAMEVLGGSMHYSRDPDALAVVVAKIINSRNPRLTYRVAEGLQKLSVRLKHLLPGRRFERMLGKHYK